MFRSFLTIIISLIFFGALGVAIPAMAAEFNVVIDRVYTLEASGDFKVVETHKITNSSSKLLISKNNSETFQISVIGSQHNQLQETIDSAKVTVDGSEVEFTNIINEKHAELSVNYPKEVKKGESMTFKLEYTNFGLTQDQGALIDIYAPGFAEDFKFNEGQTSVSYNTTIKVANSFPQENFVIPEPVKVIESNGYNTYTFSQKSLVGNTIWIQLGRSQYYNFLIIQSTPATDFENTGYYNEYRLIIPRDIEEGKISQKVYFTNIDPKPIQIKEDSEGNLIGYFKVPSHEDGQIILEGVASVSLKDVDINADNSGELNDIGSQYLSTYIAQAEFWEVDNTDIQMLAGEIKGDSTNIYDIVESTYTHIVDTIDYSQIKRFGLNERQGALNTLLGGSAVCMEYSDLFLTLSRAQGVPSRAAFGYGYDSKIENNSQEAHQWVQVYMPKLNEWVSVDVTWGESGLKIIGGDLNHFYTHVAAEDPNTPAMVERVSYGEEVELSAPEFSINVIPNLPNTSDMQSQEELLQEYPSLSADENQTNVSVLIKRIGEYIGTPSFGAVLIAIGATLGIGSLLTLVIVFVKTGKNSPKEKFESSF